MKKNLPTLITGIRIILIAFSLLLFTQSVSAQPANDNCAAAILLTSNTACINTAGTVQNATNSGVGVAPCTGTPDDDVWYSFVTTSTYHPILGVTSITDSKNNINYFEYDAYGRLNILRDKDYNILKYIKYNYKGTTEGNVVHLNDAMNEIFYF